MPKVSQECYNSNVYGSWNVAQGEISIICFIYMLYEVLLLLHIYVICLLYIYYIFTCILQAF